ncbi:hypothetical protein SAMN04244572_03255 [Azotobacter beijerinckii]|uniref:Uncharacterized protein n=1 Tax=Azotobacter beijerinckii TaxID=170623 RepID=A0A1H6XII2_9GAMM|nr:hypothetical protein SAMN04244579_02211 [Azotobacter beijerinckii]SEJ24395.1 hypothetical protein SAMN04244572_03255 [Azotobacter beijerinckii]
MLHHEPAQKPESSGHRLETPEFEQVTSGLARTETVQALSRPWQDDPNDCMRIMACIKTSDHFSRYERTVVGCHATADKHTHINQV